MALRYVLAPWDTQPNGLSDVSLSPEWRRICGPVLLASMRGRAVGGGPVTKVGSAERVGTAEGLAVAHTNSAVSIERAVIPGSGIGSTNAADGAAVLVVFRTTTTLADDYIGGLGSDQGGSGNTIFAITTGTPTASQLRGVVGGSNSTRALAASSVAINDGKVHAAIVTLDTFAGIGASRTAKLFFDGALVATDTASWTPGVNNTYNWVCSGTVRRTTDLNIGANADVLMVAPFLRNLTDAEGIALTREPLQLLAPRRIWVPVSAGGGGTNYTQSIAGSITSNGYIVKQTGKAALGIIDMFGNPVKSTTTSTKTGSITSSGATNTSGNVSQSTAGSITPSGAVSRAVTFVRNYASSITTSGTIVRAISKVVGGSITLTGSAFKRMYVAISGSIASLGALATFKFTPTATTLRSQAMRFMRKFLGRR